MTSYHDAPNGKPRIIYTYEATWAVDTNLLCISAPIKVYHCFFQINQNGYRKLQCETNTVTGPVNYLTWKHYVQTGIPADVTFLKHKKGPFLLRKLSLFDNTILEMFYQTIVQSVLSCPRDKAAFLKVIKHLQSLEALHNDQVC